MTAPKVRVLEMIDRPFLGGGQAIVLALARNLHRAAFDVSVCAEDGGPLAGEVRKLGLPFLPAEMGKRPSVGKVRALRRLLDEGRFDVLHTHGGVAGLHGRLAARRPGGPAVVHTLHGIHYLHYRNPLLRGAYVLLERFMSRRSDALVCVSEADRDRALRHKLGPADRVRLIRNGAEIGLAAPGPERERRLLELKDKLNLTSPLVGTVARLHRQKGVGFILRAAAKVQLVFPGAKMVVVGGGPLEGKLRKEAKKRGVSRYFSLLGERPDAADILGLFDVFVLPSLWEGLPLVLIEAAARGKPIVATDVEGTREVVKDGETGLLVPPGDPGAMAEAVLRLLRDPALARRLGERARAEIPPVFSLTRMVEETARLYHELALSRTPL
jgi:glycosyltransferase involved in cell wall biosynthesis